MATKTPQRGGSLEYSTNGSAYTVISDIRSFKTPPLTFGDVEITTLDSADGCREYMQGWGDGGTGTLVLYFAKTQFATFYDNIAFGTSSHTGSTRTFWWRAKAKLIGTEATNSRLDFQGHVSAIEWDEMTIDGDGAVTVPISFKVTGKPTFTAGS